MTTTSFYYSSSNLYGTKWKQIIINGCAAHFCVVYSVTLMIVDRMIIVNTPSTHGCLTMGTEFDLYKVIHIKAMVHAAFVNMNFHFTSFLQRSSKMVSLLLSSVCIASKLVNPSMYLVRVDSCLSYKQIETERLWWMSVGTCPID
jgi:hypothetical protein